MPASSSSSEAICTPTLWWPVEVVPLQVEVVEPRKLTALEWALLRVMDEFRDDPPPLSEVAEELGLDDPGFLRDTLRDVVRLRALAPRDGKAVELSDLAFTELGERLYRKGQIEAEPSTHGVTFHIDALTDEDLPEPADLQPGAPTRFLEDEVGDPRESLGLERARTAMRRFHPDILKGDAEVRALNPSPLWSSRILWRPVTLRLHLSPGGELTVEPEGLTRKAREFLSSRDLHEDDVLPARPVSDAWGDTSPARRSSGSAFSAWRRGVGEALPAAFVAARACEYVRDAVSEIVVHACWIGAPGVEEALRAAVAKGRRVLIVGTSDTCLFGWEARTGIGLQVEVENEIVGALVVDRTRGMVLDDVEVRHKGSSILIELAGTLRDVPAAKARDELVAAALSSLPGAPAVVAAPPALDRTPLPSVDSRVTAILGGDPVRMALARLAFDPSVAEGTTLTRVAVAQAPGIERVPLLRSLAATARALAPPASPAVESAWATAWEAVLEACRRTGAFPEGLIEKLAAWAPPSAAGVWFVDFAVAAWARRAPTIEETVSRLVTIASVADARWRPGIARACASWTAASDEILAPDDWTDEQVKRRVAIAARLLSHGDARDWATGLLGTIPRPASLAGIDLWRARATPLRELAGPRFEEHAAEVVGSLVAGRPAEAGAARRGVGDLLPPIRLAAILLGQTPSTQDVARVWAACGDPKQAEAWSRMSALALPDLSGSFNAPEHAEDVARFARDLAFPAGRESLATWARHLASEIQRPARPEGVAWWLGELGALAPALGEAVVALALDGVRPHAAALREARKRHGHLWEEVREAWLGLGGGDEALDSLTRDAPAAVVQSPKKDERKKEKKRR